MATPAALAASRRLNLSVIITKGNAHEHEGMHPIADRYGLPSRDFVNMSPTIYGGTESLSSQSPDERLDGRRSHPR